MIRLALCGAGRAATVWALALQAVPAARIVAVAAPTSTRAGALAASVSARCVVPSDLPAGADAVIVASPTEDHLDAALALAAAGVPVVVEQPIAPTSADADRLVAASTRAWVATADNLRYAEMLHVFARELALVTRDDPLLHLSVRLLSPDVTPERPLGRRNVEVLSALAVAALSRASSVTARAGAGQTVPQLSISFASGLNAQVDATPATSAHAAFEMQAATANAVVRLELLPQPTVERDGRAISLSPPPPGQDPRLAAFGYVNQAAAVIAALENERPPPLDADHGRSIVTVLDAIGGALAQPEIPCPTQDYR